MLDNVIQKLRERFDPLAFCNEIQTFTQLEDIDRLQLLKFQILAGKWQNRFCRFKDIDTHHIPFKDYKTTLQEVIQQNKDETLNYVIVSEDGPPHDRTFKAEVHLNSNVVGTGVGKSKKQAEQEAAKEALSLMGII